MQIKGPTESKYDQNEVGKHDYCIPVKQNNIIMNKVLC
jgi:hypothetical protein